MPRPIRTLFAAAVLATGAALMSALVSAPLPAHAQAPLQPVSPSEGRALRAACAVDAPRLCPDPSDDAALLQCLKDQRDEVLAPCKAAIGAFVARLRRN